MKTKWIKNYSGKDSSRLSFLISYLYDEQKLKTLLKIAGTNHDFTSMTPEEKNDFLNKLTKATHRQSDLYYGDANTFYSGATNGSSVVLVYNLSYSVLRYTEKIKRLFVPRFYHDRKDKNFLKNLKYIREKKEIDKKYFYEYGTSFGRRLYEYQVDENNKKIISIHPRDLDWPFPEKFCETIGYPVHGFSFKFKNAPANLKSILNPQDDLINDGDNNNLEEANNNFTNEIFFPAKKTIEEKIAEYKAIPTTNFINESYFLYDKSNLIKKTFVTAINKQLYPYGSFSYFSGKTSIKNIKLIDVINSLKFFVEKNH